MKTFILNRQQDLIIDNKQVAPIVDETIRFEGQTCDEATVHFVAESEMIELHSRFFNDPSPTDCMSFPMDDAPEFGYRNLGEVVVCPHAAHIYAAEHAVNPYEELTLYIVHGLLHLMGYDDVDEVDRLKMREAEARHMKHLHEKGLILGPYNLR